MKINEQFVYFGSNTKLKELSNFYECEIEYKGNIYNSVENVYQSLKFNNEDRVRFMKYGDLGGYSGIVKYGKIFYGGKKSDEELNKKMEYWRKRKCIGIIAKLSSNEKYSKKLGLTFNSEYDSEFKRELIFKEILKIKYKNEKFKDILKKTNDNKLIEFGRSCKRLYEKGVNDKWCGLVDNGILFGENRMGKWLMEIRDIC